MIKKHSPRFIKKFIVPETPFIYYWCADHKDQSQRVWRICRQSVLCRAYCTYAFCDRPSHLQPNQISFDQREEKGRQTAASLAVVYSTTTSSGKKPFHNKHRHTRTHTYFRLNGRQKGKIDGQSDSQLASQLASQQQG